MFQCLEEGILLVKDKEIAFYNNLFQVIIDQLKVDYIHNEIYKLLDHKVFKVYGTHEDYKNSST
jgi:hypothetical protein